MPTNTTAKPKYQVMDPLHSDDYDALKASIAKDAVLQPKLKDEDGNTIDGFNREAIAKELGIDCPSRVVTGLTDVETRTLAYTLNLGRRHLDREAKQELLKQSLITDPQLSDREHARRTGVHHSTVARLREQLEANGAISHNVERAEESGRRARGRKPGVATPPEPGAFERAAGNVNGSLANMVLPELRAQANEVGVKGTSGMRKNELIAAIRDKSEAEVVNTPNEINQAEADEFHQLEYETKVIAALNTTPREFCNRQSAKRMLPQSREALLPILREAVQNLESD